jgi:hypothetical protein
LGILFFSNLLKRKKEVVLGVVLAAMLAIPLIFAFVQPGATVRLGAVNSVSQNPELISLSSQRVLHDKVHHDLIGEVFDNRRVLLSLEIIRSYLRNFEPGWLFIHLGGNKTFLVPDFGPFYLFELPLLMLGVYFLIKEQAIPKNIKLLMLVWILASAIPSAFSSEAPHLNRTNTMLPAFTILEAMGLYLILITVYRLRSRYIKIASYGIVFVVILSSFLSFLHAYYVLFPYTTSKTFQYGVIQALLYAKEHENNYKKIVISNRDVLTEGYMYYLFAMRYDPARYQQQGGTHSAFFTDTHLIGKYDFRDPNLYVSNDKLTTKKEKGNILYIVNPGELAPVIVRNTHLIQRYQSLDGSDVIWILEGKL